MSPLNGRKLVTPALLTCVLLYAAVLRLDALFKTFGPYQQPRWLAAMQAPVRSAAATLTPYWPWHHDDTPYAGGDPINYLKFAREMRYFYAAHVREPMFPAATRIGLMLTSNEDVGISVTSIAFGLLTLVATYALGCQIGSPAVGLAAAAALAIDQSAVGWSVEGWRDELFAFFAVSSTWAWLRFAQRGTYGNAVTAGLLSGGACLTRITTLSLLAPAVVWLLLTRGPEIRRPLGLAVMIMTGLLAPFMINCAIATGDPLYAINNHTDFYLKREGVPEDEVRPISAVNYSLGKFKVNPLVALDNAVRGIFVYPFANKWVGLDAWVEGLGRMLSWLAVGGLFAWLWQRDGRLLLVMFLGSLVPFSMTWTVRGGAEWRLTFFAYAFYLIAAFWLLDRAARAVYAAVTEGGIQSWRLAPKAVIRPAAIFVILYGAGAAWAYGMPYAIARTSLASGEQVIIAAGPRDRWFFTDGWSHIVVAGNVASRQAVEPTATVRIYLPDARPYELMLRMDPAMPGRALTGVNVLLNGSAIGNLVLGWNPERVGEYHVAIPASTVTPGVNHLALGSDAGFKLWYLRIVPR